MAVGEKTRKMLWGRSGNRCAMCRHELVLPATPDSDPSVVGEECHIVSPRPGGPRHTDEVPECDLDQIENLLLLCRVHHKLIDDQVETYTAEALCLLKGNHEKWVSSSLDHEPPLPRVRIRRIRGKEPEHLLRLLSGAALLDLVGGKHQALHHTDELSTQEETEGVATFLQDLETWSEAIDLMEASDHVRAAFQLSQALKALDASGFWVFGAKEERLIEGGVFGPEPWHVAHIYVLRKTNPGIIHLEFGETNAKVPE